MKEKFKGNLLLFGKIISNKAFYREFAPVHFEIADALMNKDINRLNIIVPRGIAKPLLQVISTLYTIFLLKTGIKTVLKQSKSYPKHRDTQ